MKLKRGGYACICNFVHTRTYSHTSINFYLNKKKKTEGENVMVMNLRTLTHPQEKINTVNAL